MNYEIFTDSSANLPDELIAEHGLNIVSLVFQANGKDYVSYRPDVKSDLKEIYTLLRQKAVVTTSCVNEETFYDAFREKLLEGKDILYIGFSSALSGTFSAGASAAEKLRDEFPDRKLYAVDTLGASLGEGLLVLYACKMKEDGTTIEETRDWLEENKLKLCHFFTVDDLFYLFRGGRVKRSGYLIASLVKIKPIMHMDDEGRLMPLGKVISRRKSIQTLAQKVADNIVQPARQTLCISHGDCYEEALLLKNRIIELVPEIREVVIHYVDPVVGTHSGPGTLAVFFLGGHR